MPRPQNPDAAHVADVLISRGHHGVIVTSERTAHSAADAAAATGVAIGAITKSLVFLLDDDPVLLLVSGAHDVDLPATGARLGGTLTIAPRAMAQHATGQPIGGIAPVGHPTDLPTYVDAALAEHDELWAAAGHSNAVFRTRYSELLRITAGLSVDVGP